MFIPKNVVEEGLITNFCVGMRAQTYPNILISADCAPDYRTHTEKACSSDEAFQELLWQPDDPANMFHNYSQVSFVWNRYEILYMPGSPNKRQNT